jgi:hypothetical protein
MKRVFFGAVWTCVLTIVFLFLSAVGIGVVGFFTLKGDAEKNKALLEETTRQWLGTMSLGSFAAAVVVSALGVLPGTRRRQAAATKPPHPLARPAIVVPLNALEYPPAELAALGPPVRVHGPGILASMSGVARLVTFALGLVLLVAPLGLIAVVGPDQLPPSAERVLLISGIVAGLICLGVAIWPRSPYTYQVHEDALVVSDRKTIRIIPWDQIQALIPELPLLKDLTLVTYDGQQLLIKTSVRDYCQLKYMVFSRVRAHLLPQMLASARAGRMVEFGPLAVSGDALRYKGQTVPWEEVTSLVIVTGSGNRHLRVNCRGILSFWPFCLLNLNLVPNDLLLLELLKQIAPSRLLVSDQARW